MNKELISKKTRYEFREFFVGRTLRQIEMEFDAVDIPLHETYVPSVSGERRSLVERYYASLDFANPKDVRKLVQLYENVLIEMTQVFPLVAEGLAKWLRKDGFAFEKGRLIPITNVPALVDAGAIAREFDAEYMHNLIGTMEGSVETNPALAIGTAKELVETCCKTILTDRQISVPHGLDLAPLVKTTLKELRLLPQDVSDQVKGSESIRRLLSNLATVVQGLAEIRNLYGSGHGKDGRAKGLQPRHAKLAVGAASTLAVFMFETHKEKPIDPTRDPLLPKPDLMKSK